MDEMSGDSPSGTADQIYSAPAEAHAEAAKTLADGSALPEERAQALATLGRGAYYDNRIHDAVVYLEQALPLTENIELRAEIALMLGPALSKEGRSAEALELLDFSSTGLTAEQEGKAHNQRGVVLIELGRLPEAIAAFEQAREVHQSCGYLAGEGRALLNMAAAASEMGDQGKALTWYEEAWRLTTATDQAVMNAIIEGNLGYVASRNGDFSAALSWYSRARASFSALGEVGLLVAVLETDHATTLLDLGLNNDAFEAAEYARNSSASGTTRMLEVQASLLLGEAQVRLQQYREAENTLAEVRRSAVELDVKPWQLRCDYLLFRLRSEDRDSSNDMDAESVLSLAAGLRDAAWYREAFRTVVVAARTALDRGDRTAARMMLAWNLTIDGDSVDAIDVHQADALRAFIDGNVEVTEASLSKAFAEIDRQRQLLGSAELQARLGHRARALRALALRAPLEQDDAAAALVAQARGRLERRRSASSPTQDGLRAQMRDVRVGLQEALLQGKETAELDERIAWLEHELLGPKPVEPEQEFDPASLCALAGGAVAVSFLNHQDRVWAVRAGEDLSLIDLGSVVPIEAAARAQRTGLRRMAVRTGRENANRTDAANDRLEELLIAPLQLDPGVPLAVIPDMPVAGVSWTALPSLSGRSVTVAPTAVAMVGGLHPIRISSVGALGGPGLTHVDDELVEVADLWNHLHPTVVPQATVADARQVFASCELVHVAVHGTFRPDNPFFSSLQFHDRTLTVLDMEEFEKLPAVVVLASCDSGAASAVGVDLIGTAEALLALGVRAVVAPIVIVDDLASRRFVVDLHTELANGESIAGALCSARLLALERGTSVDVAVAQAFQVHGGEAAMQPVSISRD